MHVKETSPSNQRIESFWLSFRRSCAQGLMDLFDDMEQNGMVDVYNKRNIEILRYCFMEFVQEQIHQEVDRWNRIRERQFHSLGWGGGLEDFFSADYIFQLMLKLAFHASFEARFFFQKELNIILFLIVMLGSQLFLTLCGSDRLCFCHT